MTSPLNETQDLVELADLLLTVARKLQTGEHVEGVVPLTPTEAAVLRYVDRHPGAAPSTVASAAALQRSNLSSTLRALETKGLLRRTPDAADGRGISLQLTELAHESIAALRRHWSARLSAALAGQHGGVDAAIAVLARLEHGLDRS